MEMEEIEKWEVDILVEEYVDGDTLFSLHTKNTSAGERRSQNASGDITFRGEGEGGGGGEDREGAGRRSGGVGDKEE